MKDRSCDELDMLAYLTDCLDTKEKYATLHHLRSCAKCQADLMELSDAQGILPLALKPVSPPDSLRTQVIAEAFLQRSPVTREDAVPTVAQRRASRRSLRQWIPWSMSAALLIVCLVLGQGLLSARHQLNNLQNRLTGSATTVELQPTQYLTAAKGHAIVIPARHGVQLIVAVSNVKPTVGSEVYHVWLWNKGVRESAGTMTVGPSGVGVLQVSLNGAKAVFDGIGITLEPNPTTKVPTGPKVLGVAKI